MGKNVEVSIAMGSEHTNSTMPTNQAVPDGKTLLPRRDIPQRIGGRGVYELRQVRAEGGRRLGGNRRRESAGDDKVGFYALRADFGLGLIPDAHTTSSSALLSSKTHDRASIVQRIRRSPTEA